VQLHAEGRGSLLQLDEVLVAQAKAHASKDREGQLRASVAPGITTGTSEWCATAGATVD
jgi:hypothetical protein